MRTTDISDFGDQSCSCTSCVYKSESDRSSLRQIISRGSRIDRLYYGKYIPLRESKLLEKLVRTRAVYDDIKAQLLSSSTISLDVKSGSKAHRKQSMNKSRHPEHSDAILELVNLVDKGKKIESKELSGCCSCCSCSSKLNLGYKSRDKHGLKRTYPGAYRHNHTRERIGHSRKRGVRFKAKHIKSDPCTCTFKFSGLLSSKIKPKKLSTLHPISHADFMPTTDEEINQRPKKIRTLARSSIENLKQSKTQLKNKIMEAVKKVSETKVKVQEKIDLKTKKSPEKVTKAKNSMKSKKAKTKSREILKTINKEACECPKQDLISQIKKDSLSKFKEDQEIKKTLKDWECDSDCFEDFCIPEDCYYKLKQIGSRHLKPKPDSVKKSSIITKEKEIGEPFINPRVKIQSKELNTFGPLVQKQKPILRAKQTREISGTLRNRAADKDKKSSKREQKLIKEDKKKKFYLCKCKTKSKHKSQNVKSNTFKPVPALKNNTKIKKSNIPLHRPREQGLHIYSKAKTENVTPESRQQVVRIGSSFSFNIEFYKNVVDPSQSVSRVSLHGIPYNSKGSVIKNNDKSFVKNPKTKNVRKRHRRSQIRLEPLKKNTIVGEDNSKRCICPINLKFKRNKNKADTIVKKEIMTTEKSIMTLSSISSPLCEPVDCKVNNRCNMTECKKRNRKNFETSTYYNTPKILKFEKSRQNKSKEKRLLLPYECEPGVCEPETCDPYECVKLITKRKVKTKQHSVQCDCPSKISYTGRKKFVSSSTSIKPPSLKPNLVKVKKPTISQRSKRLKNRLKKLKKMKAETISNTLTDKSDRQVVRIGSTFSFNLEFHRTKYPYSLSPVNINNLPQTVRSTSHEKSIKKKYVKTTSPNKYLRKNSGIGTTLRRCFCTLKLQEKQNIKTKRKTVHTTGTDVDSNIHSGVVLMSTKSTKTKNDKPLKAFECKPFVCIPGACDPYECLERINKHYKHLKETGSITESAQKVTVSSTTNSRIPIKTVNTQFKPHSKDRKVLVNPYKFVSKFRKHTSDRNQAVKIGSTFSFNIEFVKNNVPSKEVNIKPNFEPKTKQSFSTDQKNKKRKINKLNVANVNTQIKEEKKLTKTTMAGHLVKRCFCTLNLQKHRKDQILSKLEHPSTIHREYTINTALTEVSPFLSCNTTFSGNKIGCNAEPLFLGNKILRNKLSQNYLHPNTFQECLSVTRKHTQTCIFNSVSADKRMSNFSLVEDKLMCLRQMEYFKHCFCTMNLQLVNKNISRKKTKSTIQSNKNLSKYDKSSAKVGSSFSFNIEFSKTTSSSLKSEKHKNNLYESQNLFETEVVKPGENKPKKLKNVGITGSKKYYNRQTHLTLNEVAHKSSVTVPMIKRCFCTLKLQKKGRLSLKNKNLQNKAPNSVNPSLKTAATINRAQNTSFKLVNKAHSLKPYECEPNICNPGYCDPYQCLEIMKRRKFHKHTKESGVDTILARRSASSLTVENISKGTQKSYLMKVKPIQSQLIFSRKPFDYNTLKPSRRVVRVGSSFSFNIEFFKNGKESSGVTPAPKYLEEIKQSEKMFTAIERNINKEILPDSRLRRNKDTGVTKSPKTTSTMTTSFTKRCFCVTQLRDLKIENVNTHLNNKSTFLNKCLCFFKSMKSFATKKEGIHIHKAPLVHKKINTQNVIKLDDDRRYPYECEPGMCTPGECNPYECYEVLKRKKYNKKSKASIAEKKNYMRSVSSSSTAIATKNIKTQLKNRKNNRDVKKKSFSQSSFPNTNRQVVKIGSNFSFNIEFYKDKLPEYNMFPPRQKLHVKSKESKYNKRNNKKLSKNDAIATLSQKSQVDHIRKKNRFTEDKHFLKRCFCTLQLRNQHSSVSKVQQIKEKKKNQGNNLSTKSIMTKKEKRQLNNLKLFECEPNICIPYQCDPYQCEKIMKIRRKQQDYKEVASLTKSPKKYSVSSATRPSKKTKHKTQVTFDKNYNINAYNNDNKESHAVQKVKIGSSFEFNIEFYNNKNNVGLDINKQPKRKNIKFKQLKEEKDTNFKERNRKHKQVQFKERPTKVTSVSTMVNNKSRLKRCFCTLGLKKIQRKSKEEKQIALKKNTSTIGIETQRPRIRTTLLPYECEPQTCIPGECNPVECLERIRQRRHKDFGSTNFLQSKSSASTMTKAKVKTKTKRNQSKYLNKDDHSSFEPKKEEAANLGKQVVRIGSNFNFNIEFYKNNIIPHNSSERLSNRKNHNALRDRDKVTKLEVRQPGKLLKTKSQLTRTDSSFIKRCSCILKNQRFQKQACVESNCPGFKEHSIQTRKHTQLYEKKNKNKIDKKMKTPTFLNKCLCVLKIRKIDKQKYKMKKVNKHSATMEAQMIPYRVNQNISIQKELLPYECEPNVCVPGICDPYECEKRIKKRNLNKQVQLSKQSATNKVKTKSTKSQGLKIKSQEHKKTYTNKNQSLTNISTKQGNKSLVTTYPGQFPKERDRLPKYNLNLDKQAVKIGSNISFNIEFYKQNAPKVNTISSEVSDHKKLKQSDSLTVNKYNDYINHKNISTRSAFIRNRGSQAKMIKTQDKTLDVQNKLNRCFCTLKLQKNAHSRYGRENFKYLGQSLQYPQIFEVRRVTVQQKAKKETKNSNSSVRSVRTQIKKKYLKGNKNSNLPHEMCMCKQDIIKLTEMETILPYAPTKFKKTCSKTILPVQDKFFNKNKIKYDQKISRAKKLHKKKSKRNINSSRNLSDDNEIQHKISPCKRILCKCASLFLRKPKDNDLINTTNNESVNSNNDNKTGIKKQKATCNLCCEHLIKSSNSDRRPIKQQLVNRNIKMKKSKSLKLDNKCDGKCNLYSSIEEHKIYPTVALRLEQKRNSKKNDNFKQGSKSAKQMLDTKIFAASQQHARKQKGRKGEKLCTHCQDKVQKLKTKKISSPPLKVHFVDTIPNYNFSNETSKYNKSVRKALNDRERNEWQKYCDYCESCGRKLNKVELLKAAGDRSIPYQEQNILSSPEKKHLTNIIRDMFNFNKDIDNVCSGDDKRKPLFEMQLNTDDYNIINKKEVVDNVTKLSKNKSKENIKLPKSHKETCQCRICNCKKHKTGAHIKVEAKGSKVGKTLAKLLSSSKPKTSTVKNPCTCGSLICSKKSQNMKKVAQTKNQNIIKKSFKPCHCGIPICDRESALMKRSIISGKTKCICKPEYEKMRRKMLIKDAKLSAIMLKKFNRKDRERRKKRLREERKIEKKINSSSTDFILAAESVIDVGKLGITAGIGVLSSVAKIASNPKQAYNTLKAMKNNPNLLTRHLKSAIENSGASATARRVRLRCMSMRGVKKIKTVLEKYAITNYLLHIADKDPKSRLPKKIKPRRVRERLDFGCSLYMASLRKRPYLSIYDRCPWFYPHFLSLVNVWKQFTDITLFLLAVVVWSPCILCMEICRAMMCCFFCTG